MIFMNGPKPTNPDGISAAQTQELITRAREASTKAYCPYSRFCVGAALLTTSGEIYTGCNVENASYGLTICAERNAIFHAVAEGNTNIKALVIYTPTERPTAPCGACRQVINEFGPNVRVICVCNGSEEINTTVTDLLPDAFGPNNLD